VALALGCQLTPPGECVVTADCEAGLACQGGVCVGCGGDEACGSWQACSTTRRCVSRVGFCSATSECAAWQDCGADHACASRPGECGTAADCGGWEQCTAGRCEPLPGRCSGQEDCPWYQACRADHLCGRPTFDPAAVAMWGTLDPSICSRRAVAPVEHPEQARVGFDCLGPGGPAAVGPQGDLFYSTGSGALRGVGRFEPDAAVWSNGWLLPAAPLVNDAAVVAPDACAGAGVDHWLLQAGSGDVLYACPAAAGFDYRDAGGAARFSGPRVLAWTAGGARLTGTASGFQVVDAAGVARPVAGLGASVEVLAARTRGEAYWVVDGAGFGAPRRYSVGAAGQAVFDGTFAALPPGVEVDAPAPGTALLDGAGVLYQRGNDGSAGVVVRRPLAPEAASVAYREADLPAGANDLSKLAFQPWVRLQGGPLLTGP
jgi:hypothetical protein